VPHPDLGRTLTHVGAKWHAPGIPWRTGPVAPTLNRDAAAVFAELEAGPQRPGPASNLDQPAAEPRLSSRGKPFALSGVRVIDLSWLVASAGAGRFLTALGAEVIKVEHHTRWDGMRWGTGAAPIGGRAERERATGPIPSPPRPTPNRSGMFSELNAGKLGISLNLKTQRGREILEQLIASADMLVEGFSPRTMERLGLGYERLREINPRLIYVQQSGMGKHGRYSDARSFGPTAQAMAGLSEMSGLPEPYAPAGIGYSYLDWFGAYNMAISMLAGLYRQRTTGLGCYIDSSQVEVGTYLTGTAVLDYSANGRRWARYGNRSPHKPAAPHGIYRVAGTDRWLAVSCFTDEQWTALCQVIGGGDLTSDDRFNTWSGRLEHQDELDAVLGQRLQSLNGTELMLALQARHVPAGICQTAEDRYEHDPQLKFLEWLVEIPHSEIGTWPIKEVPVQMSDTPFDIGGLPGRAGPCYGEDNDYVYEKILGLDKPTIQELIQQDVIGNLPSGGPE
jgi:crotonobetainyl-CoA:carnitine CoA-transferase CaiB-like acyl-CoA transferase